MVTTYKGDDTNAFDGNLLIVNLTGIDASNISRAVFQCGPLQKTYSRPKFPLHINFTSEETQHLYHDNPCYLQIFDMKGRRHTCASTITVTAS